MNIEQSLLKNSKQTKSIVENKEITYYLFLIVALLVSPIVWISLYFIGSSVLQNAIIILPCIIIGILFSEIAGKNSFINNHQNKIEA
ncbi:MAG: hypothetical protein AB8F94_27120 [Saprospiraceae bacterium]